MQSNTTKKWFRIEYVVHCDVGRVRGRWHTSWDGTIQGLKEVEAEIVRQCPSEVSSIHLDLIYVEIKAMFECFGEPVQ